MKQTFNFGTPFLLLNGKPQTEGEEVTTMGKLIGNCLVSPVGGVADTNKLGKFKLALAISNGGDVEINEDELVMMKNAIKAHPWPLVVGRGMEFLEGKTPPSIYKSGEIT